MRAAYRVRWGWPGWASLRSVCYPDLSVFGKEMMAWAEERSFTQSQAPALCCPSAPTVLTILAGRLSHLARLEGEADVGREPSERGARPASRAVLHVSVPARACRQAAVGACRCRLSWLLLRDTSLHPQKVPCPGSLEELGLSRLAG